MQSVSGGMYAAVPGLRLWTVNFNNLSNTQVRYLCNKVTGEEHIVGSEISVNDGRVSSVQVY